MGNKSVVKRKSYITMLVFISTIIILFLIVNMNENSSKIKVKGGEGYGMFDKATRIEIIFNDNEYIVSNPDEIEQIIRLCRQNWEPSNTHITKEDCDMCVKFIGTDTEVWVDTETLSSYIGESFVQMPEDLFKKIKEVVSLSNTPRPGKFVYKFLICITKISTFLILCDLAVCLATLYVSFSLVFALMRYLQGKVFLIRFYSPTTLSSSRAEFRLPSRLACA